MNKILDEDKKLRDTFRIAREIDKEAVPDFQAFLAHRKLESTNYLLYWAPAFVALAIGVFWISHYKASDDISAQKIAVSFRHWQQAPTDSLLVMGTMPLQFPSDQLKWSIK